MASRIETFCEGCEKQGRCEQSCESRDEFIYKHFILREGLSMNVNVKDRDIDLISVEKLVTGNDTYKIDVTLDESWNGYKASAVFKMVSRFGEMRTEAVLLDENGECRIPLLDCPGTLEIGVRGLSLEKGSKASEFSKPIPVFEGAKGKYLNEVRMTGYDEFIKALIGKEDKVKMIEKIAAECIQPDGTYLLKVEAQTKTFIVRASGKWLIQLPPEPKAGDQISIRIGIGEEPPEISLDSEKVVIAGVGFNALRPNAKLRVSAEFDGADWVVITSVVG